jgi:hypothetical protein
MRLLRLIRYGFEAAGAVALLGQIGLALLAAGVVGAVADFPLPLRVLALLGAGLITLAGVAAVLGAWKRSKVASLEARITDAHFRGGSAPPTGLVIDASIYNAGAPTTLRRWRLELADGRQVEEAVFHEHGSTLAEETRRGALGKETALGTLRFTLPSFTHETDIAQAITTGKLLLYVTDQNDKEWVFTQTVAALADVGRSSWHD